MDWLVDNGYKDIAFRLTKSHVFFSLLRDFMFYMHESINCSERGKVTVAFSNSRKPIKDNLFYMCWLLVESDEFITKLMFEKPQLFDISSLYKKDKDFVVNIFSKALKLTKFPLEPNLLFEVIYDGNSPNSLVGI